VLSFKFWEISTDRMVLLYSTVDKTFSSSGDEQGDRLRNDLLKNSKDMCLQYLAQYKTEHSGRKGQSGPQLEVCSVGYGTIPPF